MAPRKFKPGPVPTIGNLQKDSKWLWMDCPRCRHRRAVTLARYAILLGADTSADVMRARSKCGACGHVGGLTTLPSWAGERIGFAPFPVEE